jgi:hypothetical protein
MANQSIYVVNGTELVQEGSDGEFLVSYKDAAIGEKVSPDDIVYDQDKWLAVSGRELRDEEIPVPPQREKFAKAADDLDLEAADFYDDLRDSLLKAVEAGAMDGAEALAINFTQTPDAAIKFAEDRAAEMVGMQRTDTGTLIPNPDARWQISDDIRDDINAAVQEALREGWSTDELADAIGNDFEDWRASMIARSETGFSYNQGAGQTYKEEGFEYGKVLDGPGCLPEGHDDLAEDPEDGVIGIQEDLQANGQIWRVDTFLSYLLGHPNCVRSFVPYSPSPEELATEQAED